MLHHDPVLGLTLLHAGLPPQWDIELAQRCAGEVEAALRSEHDGRLFDSMYGNLPNLWHDDLDGADRLRFITNALTRLRVCDSSGRMLLRFKGPLAQIPAHARPWFRVPGRRTAGERIVCGHWSALGYLAEGGILALDTGCVWGGALTAQRIDVASPPVVVPSTRPAQVFTDRD